MRHSGRWRRLGVALLTLVGVVAVGGVTPSGADHTDCSRRYVAGGDALVWGKDDKDPGNDEDLRYSHQLLMDDDRLHATGPWCEYNVTREEPTTTKDFVDTAMFEGLTQQSAAWEREPRLITLSLGRQNDKIVDHIDKCFKNVKDHDFLDANACALQVYAPGQHWDDLKKDLARILNTFRIQQDGQPNLIVAVTGYPNPYPAATDVATKIPAFCNKLVAADTMVTCIARWILLPPALVTLDQVVQKLNTTISEVVKEFEIATQGRFVFVNPYEKFKDHCMDMKVTIKTTVYHPTKTVHDHDTQETNFGCDKTWIGSDDTEGNKSPFLYLTPATTGVLILATQTTKEMGVNPNKDGHDCIADLVWEAVKNKLDVPQAPAPDDVCKGDS